MWVLLIPFIELFLTAVIVFTAYNKRYGTVVCLLLGLLALNWLTESCPLHIKRSKSRDTETIRILSYNLHDESDYINSHKEDIPHDLLASIKKVDPDIFVCYELMYYKNPNLVDTLKSIFSYNSFDLIDRKDYDCTLVFSKYPLSDCKKLKYLFCDTVSALNKDWIMTVTTPNGNVKLAACHFFTNQCSVLGDTTHIKKNKSVKNLFAGLVNGYSVRANEADAMRDSLDKYSSPTIVAGDFNDISGSYALRRLKGDNLVDAWWEGGNGYGHTFRGHGLLFRLDHILYSKKDFELCGVRVLSDWKYSDHYPIVADFKFK